MTRFGGEPVTVPLGPCACPGTPHAGGDEAYLLPRLSFDAGMAAEAILHEEMARTVMDQDAIARRLSRCYIEHQVTGWNLTNGHDGEPLPYAAAALLSDWALARKVADAADDLYSGDLLAPLVAAVSTSSQPGQTAGSTSPRTRSGSKHRKR